jgi:hypothetical protein
MNIDLIVSAENAGLGYERIGILCDQPSAVSFRAAIFNDDTRQLEIEFKDPALEPLELNIAVAEDFDPHLQFSTLLQVGFLGERMLWEAYQIPLLGSFSHSNIDRTFQQVQQTSQRRSIRDFEFFLRNAEFAQAVHRVDLAHENLAGPVLGDQTPSSIKFSPKLVKELAMILAPQDLQMLYGPRIVAPQPGMNLGGSNSIGVYHPPKTIRPKKINPPKKPDEEY